MRKIIFLGLTAVCLLSLSACVKKDTEENVQTSESVSVTETASSAASTGNVDSTPQPTSSAQTESQASSAIIAESSNAVSDKEKQAILDELSDELDSALNGTEDLEGLDDSDLDTDNIE